MTMNTKSVLTLIMFALVLTSTTALAPTQAFAATCLELGNCAFDVNNPLESFTEVYKETFGSTLFSIILCGIAIMLVWWRSGSHIVATMVGLVFYSLLVDAGKLTGPWEIAGYYGQILAVFAVGASGVFIFKRASSSG